MKNQFKTILISVSLILTCFFVACQSKVADVPKKEYDAHAKQQLQGTWINELEGNVVFRFRGDSVFYDDSLSNPTVFYVIHDTLFIENHPLTAYVVKRLNSSELEFVNSEGDIVTLQKSKRLSASESGNASNVATGLNQGKKIKKDTILVSGSKRYHAYTQVNPTTYRVYRQSINSDGIKVESVYYDNIVYIALYDGQRKIYGSNITKQDFLKLVPESYISQAILSDVKVENVRTNGVRFVAVLTIPDGYTNYRVNIDIDDSGKKKLSL